MTWSFYQKFNYYVGWSATIYALIYLLGTCAFILLLVKAAKHHEVLPKLLCLLFVVPYALSTAFYFDQAFSHYYTYSKQTWYRWISWATLFCIPQALVLITYLLFVKVISFEQHTHKREKKEKLIGLLAMANAVYNFLFIFLFPIINITSEFFAYRSDFWLTTGYYIFWAVGLSEFSKHMRHNPHHNS